MLRRLHRDIHGRVNIVHYVLSIAVLAGVYATFMYYPPYMQNFRIRTAARDLALQGSTIETDDGRNKAWFDSRMGEMGYEYPLARDLTYYRYDRDTVEVSFEYAYDVNHFFLGEPHTLRFMYRCKAHKGHCQAN
jgi:hypothetical protein